MDHDNFSGDVPLVRPIQIDDTGTIQQGHALATALQVLGLTHAGVEYGASTGLRGDLVERYQQDPTFHRIVDMLVHVLEMPGIHPADVREAHALAQVLALLRREREHEEPTPRDEKGETGDH